MHIHARVHRWVFWWFYVGVACGAVALVNIMGRDLSRSQEKIILLMGVMHWVLGGLVCYACDGIEIQEPPEQPKPVEPPQLAERVEWHSASDFVLPGSRRSPLRR